MIQDENWDVKAPESRLPIINETVIWLVLEINWLVSIWEEDAVLVPFMANFEHIQLKIHQNAFGL